jgi:hypothetical protein
MKVLHFMLSIYLVLMSFAAKTTQLTLAVMVSEKINAPYSIDNKEVSKEEFERFLANLKELYNTWFCAETSTGGTTGYDATDQHGVIYEFQATSDSGKNTNTLRKKESLPFSR